MYFSELPLNWYLVSSVIWSLSAGRYQAHLNQAAMRTVPWSGRSTLSRSMAVWLGSR